VVSTVVHDLTHELLIPRVGHPQARGWGDVSVGACRRRCVLSPESWDGRSISPPLPPSCGRPGTLDPLIAPARLMHLFLFVLHHGFHAHRPSTVYISSLGAGFCCRARNWIRGLRVRSLPLPGAVFCDCRPEGSFRPFFVFFSEVWSLLFPQLTAARSRPDSLSFSLIDCRASLRNPPEAGMTLC